MTASRGPGSLTGPHETRSTRQATPADPPRRSGAVQLGTSAAFAIGGTGIAIAAGIGVVYNAPMTVAIAVAIAVLLWLLTRTTDILVAAATAGAVIGLTAVPILRLVAASRSVGVAVLAGLAVVVLLVVLRAGIARSIALPLTLFGALCAFELMATLLRVDDNEWPLFLSGVFIGVIGLLLGATVGVRARWPRIQAVIIGVALSQAGLALVEVALDLRPIWRGARILASGQSVGLPSEIFDGMRAQGTFGHPLPLAFFLLVALSFVLFGGYPLRFRLASGALLVAGIAATGSRSAVAIAICLILIATAQGENRRYRLPFLAAGVVLALAFLAPAIVASIETLAATGSVHHRLGALDAVGRLVSDRSPLERTIGDGSGSTTRLFLNGTLQTDAFLAVDNQFVLTLAQDGIVGVIILAGLVWTAIGRARGAIRIALGICVLEFFVMDVLAWPSTAFVFWLLVGVAFAQAAERPVVDDAEHQHVDRGLTSRPISATI